MEHILAAAALLDVPITFSCCGLLRCPAAEQGLVRFPDGIGNLTDGHEVFGLIVRQALSLFLYLVPHALVKNIDEVTHVFRLAENVTANT